MGGWPWILCGHFLGMGLTFHYSITIPFSFPFLFPVLLLTYSATLWYLTELDIVGPYHILHYTIAYCQVRCNLQRKGYSTYVVTLKSFNQENNNGNSSVRIRLGNRQTHELVHELKSHKKYNRFFERNLHWKCYTFWTPVNQTWSLILII